MRIAYLVNYDININSGVVYKILQQTKQWSEGHDVYIVSLKTLTMYDSKLDKIAKLQPLNFKFKEGAPDRPIAINFYADREANGPIHRYYTSFYYYAFALNRHLYADRLIEMLPAILMDWYGGNEPFKVKRDGKEYLYKIDGNRMIELSIYDLSMVTATYYDLTQINFRESGPWLNSLY